MADAVPDQGTDQQPQTPVPINLDSALAAMRAKSAPLNLDSALAAMRAKGDVTPDLHPTPQPGFTQSQADEGARVAAMGEVPPPSTPPVDLSKLRAPVIPVAQSDATRVRPMPPAAGPSVLDALTANVGPAIRAAAVPDIPTDLAHLPLRLGKVAYEAVTSPKQTAEGLAKGVAQVEGKAGVFAAQLAQQNVSPGSVAHGIDEGPVADELGLASAEPVGLKEGLLSLGAVAAPALARLAVAPLDAMTAATLTKEAEAATAAGESVQPALARAYIKHLVTQGAVGAGAGALWSQNDPALGAVLGGVLGAAHGAGERPSVAVPDEAASPLDAETNASRLIGRRTPASDIKVTAEPTPAPEGPDFDVQGNSLDEALAELRARTGNTPSSTVPSAPEVPPTEATPSAGERRAAPRAPSAVTEETLPATEAWMSDLKDMMGKQEDPAIRGRMQQEYDQLDQAVEHLREQRAAAPAPAEPPMRFQSPEETGVGVGTAPAGEAPAKVAPANEIPERSTLTPPVSVAPEAMPEPPASQPATAPVVTPQPTRESKQGPVGKPAARRETPAAVEHLGKLPFADFSAAVELEKAGNGTLIHFPSGEAVLAPKIKGKDRALMFGYDWARQRAGLPALSTTTAVPTAKLSANEKKYAAMPTDALGLELQKEQVRLETENNKAMRSNFVRNQDVGRPISGSTGAGTVQAKLAAKRIEQLEAEMKKRGVSDEEIMQHRLQARVGNAERQGLSDEEGDTSFDPGSFVGEPVIAYHGTPHTFPKFSLEHVGSGEGNAAWGYGAYAAGDKRVGMYYRDVLSGHREVPHEVINTIRDGLYNLGFDSWRDALHALEQTQAADPKTWQNRWEIDPVERERWKIVTDFVEQPRNRGQLHTWRLPDNETLLHWDKPLSEQPTQVTAALKKAYPDWFREEWVDVATRSPVPDAEQYGLTPAELQARGLYRGIAAADISGGEFYKMLASEFGGSQGRTNASQKQTSEHLAALGIPGLQYYDGSSRNSAPQVRAVRVDGTDKWEVNPKWNAPNQLKTFDTKAEAQKYADSFGHHNYVIFDDKQIEHLSVEEAKKAYTPEGIKQMLRGEAKVSFGSVAEQKAALAPHRADFAALNASKVASAPGGPGEPMTVQQRLAELKAHASQHKDWINYQGVKIDSDRALARVMHTLRDPKIEHAQSFFSHSSDNMVRSHTAVTSGALSAVQVYTEAERAYIRGHGHPPLKTEYTQSLIAHAKAVGSDQVDQGHNHPSGEAVASAGDQNVQGWMAAEMARDGITLRYHVVIDHGKYALMVVSPSGSVEVHNNVPFEKLPAAYQVSEGTATGPSQLAAQVKTALSPTSSIAAYVDQNHGVIAVEHRDPSEFAGMNGWLPQRMQDLGARGVFFAGPADAMELAGRAVNEAAPLGQGPTWANDVLDILPVQPDGTLAQSYRSRIGLLKGRYGINYRASDVAGLRELAQPSYGAAGETVLPRGTERPAGNLGPATGLRRGPGAPTGPDGIAGGPSGGGTGLAERDLFGNESESASDQGALFSQQAGTEASRSLKETEAAARAELAQLAEKEKVAAPVEKLRIAKRMAELQKLVNRDKGISAGEMATRAKAGDLGIGEGVTPYNPQTETPAFAKWFAGSKVVDAEGKPLVVYHASTFGDFDTFDKAEQRKGAAGFGFYFTDKTGTDIYSDYGKHFQAAQDYRGNPKRQNVMPVYLRMDHPLVVNDILDAYDAISNYPSKILEPGRFGQARSIAGLGPDEKAAIQRQGYDGVIANEYVVRQRAGSYKVVPSWTKGAIAHPVYVVFEPDQIKSATGNSGAFDPNNPSIIAEGQTPYNGGSGEPPAGEPPDLSDLELPEPAGFGGKRGFKPFEMMRSLRAYFNPESLGPEAKYAAGTIRARNAERFQKSAQTLKALGDIKRYIDGLKRPEQLRIYNLAEHGESTGQPYVDAMNRVLRTEVDRRTQKLIEADRLQAERVIANYLGRYWADDEDLGGRIMQLFRGKKPFEGPKSFLKKRTWPLFADGLRAIADAKARLAMGSPQEGDETLARLKPATYNYVEGSLHKIDEMDRLIAADAMKEDEKKAGRAKAVMFSQEPPTTKDGRPWTKIDPTGKDPAFAIYGPHEGMVKLPDEAKAAGVKPEDVGVYGSRVIGAWYAHPDAAETWRNFMSKGLAGPWYDAATAPGRAATQFLLGFSGFHGTQIAAQGMFSELVNAADRAMMGEAGASARALGRIASGPLANTVNAAASTAGEATRVGILPKGLRESKAAEAARARAVQAAAVSFGQKILDEYLKPGTYPELTAVIKAMVQGGARITAKSELWQGDRIDAFKTAMRKALEEVKAPAALTKLHGVSRAPQIFVDGAMAGIEALSAPLMSKFVPLMKSAATYQAVAIRLAQLERANIQLSQDDFRNEMWKIVQDMDYRFGQVVYDNFFMNNTVKHVAQLLTFAPGWTSGSALLGVHGVADIGKIPKRIYERASGKPNPTAQPIVGQYGKYMIAVAVATAILGALYTYYHTGQMPGAVDGRDDGWKDFIFPRDGTLDVDGNPNRIRLPGYEGRDWYDWSQHPVQTAVNKENPFLSFMTHWIENRTYFGDMVRNPEDPKFWAGQLVGPGQPPAGHEGIKDFASRELNGTQAGQTLKYTGQAFAPLSLQNYMESLRRGDSKSASLQNFLGITPAKREVVRTPAQNKEIAYLSQRGQAAATPEAAAAQGHLRNLLLQMREGSDASQSVADAVEHGDLTGAKMTQLLKRAQILPYQERFKSLTLDQALTVFDLATPDEQAHLAGILSGKIQRAAKAASR